MKTLSIYPNGQIFLTTRGVNKTLTIQEANEIINKGFSRQGNCGDVIFYKIK
jgi:hypothetical protein